MQVLRRASCCRLNGGSQTNCITLSSLCAGCRKYFVLSLFETHQEFTESDPVPNSRFNVIESISFGDSAFIARWKKEF